MGSIACWVWWRRCYLGGPAQSHCLPRSQRSAALASKTMRQPLTSLRCPRRSLSADQKEKPGHQKCGRGVGVFPPRRSVGCPQRSGVIPKAVCPRMGGEKMMRTRRGHLRWWVIPAEAGKMGGTQLAALLSPGSSPRRRGECNNETSPQYAQGVIPAWAGRIARNFFRKLRIPGHPRVGGENTS